MALTFDTSIDVDHATASSATDSFTMGSGTHGILILFVPALSANGVLSGVQVSGTPTYNGSNMTHAAADGASVGEANENIDCWYMIDPPSGAHNIVVALGGTPNGRPNGWHVCAISYLSSGVLTVSGATSGNGTTNAPSLTVTTTAGDHAIAACFAIQTAGTALSAGPTNERQNFGISSDAGIGEFSAFADADKDAAGASTALAWTSHSTQHWRMVGFSITEAAGAGSGLTIGRTINTTHVAVQRSGAR